MLFVIQGVTCFTNVSFIIVISEKMLFGLLGNFLLQFLLHVAAGKSWLL